MSEQILAEQVVGSLGAGALVTLVVLKLAPLIRKNGNGNGSDKPARQLTAGEYPPERWDARFDQLVMISNTQTEILKQQTTILQKIETNTAVLMDRSTS